MKNFSATIAGILVMVLGAIAKLINIEFSISEQELTNALLTIIQILGLILAYIGRVRQGDISWYGRRIYTPRT